MKHQVSGYLSEWKGNQTNSIRVGKEYQAEIPCVKPRGSCDTVNNNEDDQLLWNPAVLPVGKVEGYLNYARSLFYTRKGKREDDILSILHQNEYDIDKAMEHFQRNSILEKPRETWSEIECRHFEEGLKKYGKNFAQIQKVVVSRRIQEVVSFYYLWKKTVRHDVFIQELCVNKRKIKKKLRKKFSHSTEFGDVYMERESLTLSKKYSQIYKDPT